VLVDALLESEYLHDLGVNRHPEGETGAEGKAQHGDPAADDLRMLLQDSVGGLQRGSRKDLFLETLLVSSYANMEVTLH